MMGLPAFRKPEPRLADERIFLRLPRRGDHEEWARLRGESRDFLEPWEPRWALDELSPAAWRDRLRRYRTEFAEGTAVPFLIFEQEHGRMAGGISLSNIRYGVSQSASIGYWMGARYAGQGMMVAALKLLIPYSFDTLRLHRLEAACIPDNNRSIRVLEKAGFTREGLLHSYLKINSAWQDHYLYALVSDRAGNQN